MHGKIGTLFVMLVLLSASISIIPFTFTAEAAVFGESVLVNGHEAGTQMSPRITVDASSNISVVWADYQGGQAIYYGRSEDDGGTFLPKVKVDDAGVPSQRSSPAVAVNDTGSIFIVWSDERGGVSRIYFSKSDDNGSTFSANLNVSALGSIVQSEPDIAIANSTIYVVWAEDTNGTAAYPNVFMSRSLDWGQTFLTPVRIDSTGSSSSIQAFPSIAARNNSVFIIWHDSRSDSVLDIYGSYSSDLGESFGQNIKVSDGKSETRQSMCDAAIMPDGSPCAVWHDGRSGDLDVRFAKSIDGGAHFLSSVLVSDGAPGTQQADPQMAIDSDGNVSVVYRDNTRGTYHVKYATSRNSGISFSSSVYADDAPTNVGTVDSVDVATNPNGTPMVVYDDDFAGSMDIYFTKMIDRPPMCQINFPSEGAAMAGNVTVLGNASDPDGNDTLISVEVRVLSIGGPYDAGWILANGTEGWNFKVNTSTLVNGSYEIQARSYDGQAYSETATIQVTVENEGQKWPDLAVTDEDMSFSPGQVEAGSVVTISAAVWNLGNLNTTNVGVRFERGSALVGETSIDLIPFGENRTASVQWVAMQGIHVFKVTVDPGNLIVELNETNNQASKTITVLSSTFYQPDLEISAQNFTLSSDEIKSGDSVVLKAEVFNFGNEGATNVMVVFAVDGNQVGGQQFISYIPVNNSREASVTWVASTGHHTLNVTVDPTSQITERNESNNRASLSIEVKAAGGAFPIWIIVVGVAIPLVLAVVIIYVMKWRRPKY
jgi:hypothetical protein